MEQHEVQAELDRLTGKVHDFIGVKYLGRAEAAAVAAEGFADHVGETMLNAADLIRGEVSTDADRAEAAAVEAEVAAGAAGSAAAEAVEAEVSRLVGDAPEAFDTLGEIADELSRNETERSSLANTIGKKADKDDVAAGLAEKADKVDVEAGLAKKADAEAVEAALAERADVEAMEAGLAEKLNLADATDQVVAGAVVRRHAGRGISVGSPQYDSDAASKKYVDDEVREAVSDKATVEHVATEVDKAVSAGVERITATVNARPALFDGQGPPVVIEGAVPGDKYMDMAAMEIYILRKENTL